MKLNKSRNFAHYERNLFEVNKGYKQNYLNFLFNNKNAFKYIVLLFFY